MGVESDAMAVVDSNARVFGVKGVRVVDASAFPFCRRDIRRVAFVSFLLCFKERKGVLTECRCTGGEDCGFD